jgi:hypothetical protein
MKITIKCRISSRKIEEVEIDTEDHLFDLLDKLIELGHNELTDEDTKFTYNTKTYSMNARTKFTKIGMNSNASIVVFNQAISGKVIFLN